MSLFTAQLYPHRALGFLTLGAFLHDTLTRLKAEPQRFPKLHLVYSRTSPLDNPIIITLPLNGLRLQFDAREQRLRLIEVLDFSKNHITYNNVDLVKPPEGPVTGQTAPSFRHIYNKFLGPTYNGEFIPPKDGSENGVYVLSYPGVAFTFALPKSSYHPSKDVVTLLSTAPTPSAQSMAIFNGTSWAVARSTLYTEILPSIKSSTHLPRSKDVVPDEISLVRLHGGGILQLFKKWTDNSIWIHLGHTSAQDLVALLGPPNAIYRKNDQRMTIHKQRTTSVSQARPGISGFEGATSNQMAGYDGIPEGDVAAGTISVECFYNYFYLGFDILVSSPREPSPSPPRPASSPVPSPPQRSLQANRLVATKVILHGNMPGSYEFNRHRRIRWDLSYLSDNNDDKSPIDSETPFPEIMRSMTATWSPLLKEGDTAKWEDGMVLNRGWGDSPGNSCELMGGWEEEAEGVDGEGDGDSASTTTLYGLPGMVFEVLRNGFVNTVTVF